MMEPLSLYKVMALCGLLVDTLVLGHSSCCFGGESIAIR